MVLLVILRLSLGCHFLYEGVWKIKHPEFSAEGFLTQAKGPAAGIFYAMVPDLDGRDRLEIEKLLTAESLVSRWQEIRDKAEIRYAAPYTKRVAAFEARRKGLEKEKEKLSPDDQKTLDQAKAKIEQIAREFGQPAQRILWEHEDKLEAFVAEHERDILAYFGERNSGQAAGDQKAAANVKSWLSEVDGIQNAYLAALEKSVENNREAKIAVTRSVREAIPVFDEKKPIDKFVGNSRLLDTEEEDIIRAARRIRASKFYEPWYELKEKVVAKYDLDDPQQAKAETIYRRYKTAVKSVLAENQDDIEVYFDALKRFEDKVAAGNLGAAHQKERVYQERQKLRKEVGAWLKGLEATEKGCQDALAGLLTPEQAERGKLPVGWTQTDLIDFAVTYGLTAIGLCLMLGLFTRPAALAGGCFMISVVLTQPAWPTIYPPDPPTAGHALLINKDFVEMVALFMLATTAVGRWGGLDYFVENYILRLLGLAKNKSKQ